MSTWSSTDSKDSNLSDLKSLFSEATPMIDVRAPCEFQKGCIPGSLNLPILNDEERARVGTTYKELGRDAALALGFELVQGEIKEERVANWIAHLKLHRQSRLFCFRGGLRSQIAAQWIREAGHPVETLPGGYKGLRNRLMEHLVHKSKSIQWLILSGRTGVGKTRFLLNQSLNQKRSCLDLEGLANHRGSAFGGRGTQPTQISFENEISRELLFCDEGERVLLENESRMIGNLKVPDPLFDQMKIAPMVVLEASLEERVLWIRDEYIVEQLSSRNQSLTDLEAQFASALQRISPRLGGKRYLEASELLRLAFQKHREDQDLSGHDEWITYLLHHYYDPLYDRSQKRNEARTIFRGNASAVLEFLVSGEEYSDPVSEIRKPKEVV